MSVKKEQSNRPGWKETGRSAHPASTAPKAKGVSHLTAARLYLLINFSRPLCPCRGGAAPNLPLPRAPDLWSLTTSGPLAQRPLVPGLLPRHRTGREEQASV